jgi:hypothetical protein
MGRDRAHTSTGGRGIAVRNNLLDFTAAAENPYTGDGFPASRVGSPRAAAFLAPIK